MIKDEIKNVYDWLSTADVKRNQVSGIPARNQFILFLRLMLEELSETAESGGEDILDEFNQIMKAQIKSNELLLNTQTVEPDYTLFRDGMADLQVVLQNGNYMSGASIEDVLEDVNEVMKSNFSKFCITEKEARSTVDWYKENKNLECYIVEKNGFYIVKRKEDNKIMKSINFKQPKL